MNKDAPLHVDAAAAAAPANGVASLSGIGGANATAPMQNWIRHHRQRVAAVSLQMIVDVWSLLYREMIFHHFIRAHIYWSLLLVEYTLTSQALVAKYLDKYLSILVSIGQYQL